MTTRMYAQQRTLTAAEQAIIDAINRANEAKQAALEARRFVWPVNCGHRVNSEFGWRWRHWNNPARWGFHEGVDIPCVNNTRVNAMAAGRVVFVGSWSGGGNTIGIGHENGYMTVYMHLSRFGVALGQEVGQGYEIGRTGDSGSPGAFHLHFEVRKEALAPGTLRATTRLNPNAGTPINPILEYHINDSRSGQNNPNPVFVRRNNQYVFNDNFNFSFNTNHWLSRATSFQGNRNLRR